jgi:predicted ATPase
MGTVHEAYDRETRALVALKTFKHFSGHEVYKLKREFRALADLHHENLVRLGELHCDGDRWFFTMELVRGENLLQYVRAGLSGDGHSTSQTRARLDLGPATLELGSGTYAQAPAGSTLREERLRASLSQLARALCELHAAGCIHCDVKPSNVLIEATGRVVLLDFGISYQLGCHGPQRGIVEGTLPYMAPELVSGAPPSPAADWYAFGALLFEAVSGRLPFAGDPRQVLAAKRLGAPRIVLQQEVPEDLLALSLALLHSDPRRRPGGEQVLAALGHVAGAPAAPAVAHFVGRRAELDVVYGWLEDQDTRPWCGLIEGEAGIGKTALLHAALDVHLRKRADILLLRGRCYEQESLPYKAWDGLLDALSEQLVAGDIAEAELDRLAPSGLHALALVFPVLRRVASFDAQVRSAPGPWREDVERRATAALVQLFGVLCERRQILLVVDDLHWSDDASLALFMDVLSSVAAAGVGLLATSRIPHPQLQARLGGRSRSLKVGPLSSFDAQGLAEQVLEHTGRVAEIGALCAEASGHPLHLLELCRYVSREPRAGPNRLLESLGARIAALDDRARRVVELVAVAAAPVPLESLALAAAMDRSECQRLVRALSSQHILRPCTLRRMRAVEAYHDRIREACLQTLLAHPAVLPDPSCTRTPAPDYVDSLHWSLAHALYQSLSEDEQELELPRIALGLCAGVACRSDLASHHLAIDLSLGAARGLRRAGAFSAAAAHCQRALSLLAPDGACRDHARTTALHRELMELYGHSGDCAASEAHYAALLQGARDGLERAAAHGARAWLEVRATSYQAAIETIRRGLHELSTTLPQNPHPLQLLAKLLSILVRHAPVSAARARALPGCTDARARCEMELLVSLSPPSFVQGRNTLGAMAMLHLAELSLERGVSSVSAYGIAGLGMVLRGAFGATGSPMQCADAALALAERFGDPLISSYVAVLCGGFIWPWAKPIEACRELLERGLSQAAGAGDRIHIDFLAVHVAINVVLAATSFGEAARVEQLASSLGAEGTSNMLASLGCLLRPWIFLQDRDGASNALDFAQRADAALAREFPGAPDAVHYGHHVLKGVALTLAHAPEHALDAFARADTVRGAGFGLPLVAEHVFHAALAHCMLAPRSLAARAAAASRLTGALLAHRRWARDCPSTFGGRRLLLMAEQARLWGWRAAAKQRYAEAAAHARAQQQHIFAALAAERAARLEQESGQATARPLLEQAASAWRAVEGWRIARHLDAELNQPRTRVPKGPTVPAKRALTRWGSTSGRAPRV